VVAIAVVSIVVYKVKTKTKAIVPAPHILSHEMPSKTQYNARECSLISTSELMFETDEQVM